MNSVNDTNEGIDIIGDVFGMLTEYERCKQLWGYDLSLDQFIKLSELVLKYRRN